MKRNSFSRKALRAGVGLLAALAGVCLAQSASGQVVISQLWMGGSSGTPNVTTSDTVELYNAGVAPVDLTDWSIHVSAATAVVWTRIPLAGSMPAGGFLLVRTGGGTPTSANGVNYDIAVAGSDSPVSSGGKVALVNASNTSSITVACPIGTSGAYTPPVNGIVDFVGYGSADCREVSTLPGATSSNAIANNLTGAVATRRRNTCTDTNDNAADFEASASPAAWRNSGSSPLIGGVALNASAAPSPVNAGLSTTLTVSFASCGAPLPTITSVTGDLTAFGLSNAETFTGGPPSWTYSLLVPVSQGSAVYSIPFSATDGTTTYTGSASLRVIGPPPSNDLCTAARVLSTFPESINEDNSTATADADPGACNTGTQGNFGVWYVFTPATTGAVVLNETSTQFAAWGVWSVPIGSSQVDDCNNFSFAAANVRCTTLANWGFIAVPGNRYYIQLGSSSMTAPTVPLAGTIDFITATPANDVCESATDISASTFPLPFSVDNRFATDDVDPGTCTTATVGQQGVWYRYTASTSGALQFTETGAQDIVWGVWIVPSSTPNPATDCAGFLSTSSALCTGTDAGQLIAFVPGNTYYILLSNASTTSTPLTAAVGLFNIVQAPANDLCTGATLISAAVATTPQQFVLDNSVATADPIDVGTCNLSTLTSATSGVWYVYSHTGSPATLLLSEVSAQNIVTGVWEVDTASAACPSAGPATICNALEAFTFPVLPGKTYYLLISTDSATVSTIPIDVTFSTLLPPANDDCPTATTLSSLPASFVVGNAGAVSSALDPGTCNTGLVANFDVWYRYDATTGGVLQLAETSSQDIVTATWTSPTAAAVCPTSGLPTLACVTGDVHNIVVAAGTTYFIQISQSGTAIPAVPIAVRFSFFPTPPSNDECVAATNLTGTGVFSLANVGATTGTTNTPIACPTTSLAMNNDAWYRWVAPSSGSLALNTRTIPSAFSGRYALYDGSSFPGTCPTSGGPLGCNLFTSSSSTAALSATVVGGNVYYLQIASTTIGTTGVVDVELVLDPTDAQRCCLGSSCTLVSAAFCSQLSGTSGGPGSVCAATTATVSSYTGAGGAIPDGSSGISQGSLSSTIDVPDAFVVENVELDLVLAHTHAGDIIIELSKGPDTIVLSNRGRRNATPAGLVSPDFVNTGTYSFTDTATQSVFDQIGLMTVNPIAPGTYRPASILGVSPSLREAFNGKAAAGAWTLRILDQVSADTGSLTSWTLRLTRGTNQCVPATVVCCRGVTCAVISAVDCTAPPGIGTSTVTGTTCAGQSAIFAGCCYADFNKSGVKDVADIFAFLSAWFANSPFSDVGGDGTGTRDVSDIFQFLSAWFVGCV